MTNELEKQFFQCFGIEPKFKGYSNAEELYTGGVIPCGNIKYFNTIEEMDKANYWCFSMWELDNEDKEYPQITDRILLELICILTKRFDYADQNWLTKCNDTKELKVSVLRLLLLCPTSIIEEYKHQVQALFEEG